MTDDACRAARVAEQYARALNLAETVWRSETDTVLNQDRLAYLRRQYVVMLWAEMLAERDAALASAEQMIERKNAALARPCIRCGYQSNIIQAVAPTPRAEVTMSDFALWNKETGNRSPREQAEALARQAEVIALWTKSMADANLKLERAEREIVRLRAMLTDPVFARLKSEHEQDKQAAVAAERQHAIDVCESIGAGYVGTGQAVAKQIAAALRAAGDK